MLSLDVIDDMLNRLSGRRTMTEPTLDKTLEKSRELARRISLDVMDMSDGKLPFDRQQMENELTEALVVFAHECLHDDARAALAADEGELVEALRHAVAIIRQYVPVDALGTNGQGGGDGWNDQSWPILEEYLSYMDAALARHAKE